MKSRKSESSRWEERGISWEADQHHAELIVEQLNSQDAKSITSPGSKEEEQRETATEAKRARMIEGNTIDSLEGEIWVRKQASQDDID